MTTAIVSRAEFINIIDGHIQCSGVEGEPRDLLRNWARMATSTCAGWSVLRELRTTCPIVSALPVRDSSRKMPIGSRVYGTGQEEQLGAFVGGWDAYWRQRTGAVLVLIRVADDNDPED